MSTDGALAHGSGSETWRNPAFIALLALWVLVPVITSNLTATHLFKLPFTYDQTSLPKVAVFLVLTWLGIVLWAVSLSKNPTWRLPFGWASLLSFLVVASFGVLQSVSPIHSIFGWYTRYEGLVVYVSYAALFFLAVQVLRPSRWIVLARTGLWVGTTVAAYGVAQTLGYDPSDWLSTSFETVRAFSTYGNPDFLAGYLIFPISFGAVLACTEKNRRARVLTSLALGVCLVCEIATLARGGWIGTIVCLALVLAALARAGVRAPRHLVIVALLGLLGAALLFQNSPMNPVGRLSSLLHGSDAGVTGRFEIWRAGVRAFADRPVLGSGLETFSYAARDYFAATAAESADRAHSLPLQLLVTTGVLGFGAYALFLGRAVVASARAAFTPDASDSRSLIYLAAWAAVVGHVASLLVGISLPGTTSLLFITLGVLARPLSRRAPMMTAVRPWIMACAAVLLVAVSWSACRAVRADGLFVRARHAARMGQPRDALVREAVRLNPVPERYQLELRAIQHD